MDYSSVVRLLGFSLRAAAVEFRVNTKLHVIKSAPSSAFKEAHSHLTLHENKERSTFTTSHFNTEAFQVETSEFHTRFNQHYLHFN